mmetsp:Transcript_46638/g.73008  ORF Transcript_46638/g.73008 Transcript_46638/m.73008 type:complete len:283 (+) Transcript_46638:309-1157(+)
MMGRAQLALLGGVLAMAFGAADSRGLVELRSSALLSSRGRGAEVRGEAARDCELCRAPLGSSVAGNLRLRGGSAAVSSAHPNKEQQMGYGAGRGKGVSPMQLAEEVLEDFTDDDDRQLSRLLRSDMVGQQGVISQSPSSTSSADLKEDLPGHGSSQQVGGDAGLPRGLSWCSRSGEGSRQTSEQDIVRKSLEEAEKRDEDEAFLVRGPMEDAREAAKEKLTHRCSICDGGIGGAEWYMAGNQKHCSPRCAEVTANQFLMLLEEMDEGIETGDSARILLEGLV